MQITANYIGANNGSYGTASVWDINQVPLNGPLNTYSVNISNSRTVQYTIAGKNSIDQLFLDLGTGLVLGSGNLLNPADLTVLGKASIAGGIAANAANFTATGAGSSFIGNTNWVNASNGAVVRIAGAAFNASALYNATLISATGAGTLVDLSAAQSFNAGQTTNYNNTVSATGGGRIDLSGLKTLTAAASAAALYFNINSGSSIDLSSLQTVGGVTDNSGSTVFNLDGASATIGALQKSNRFTANLANGATLNLGSSGAQANVTNLAFAVSGGSRLNGAALRARWT